jgi:hypothetical protein
MYPDLSISTTLTIEKAAFILVKLILGLLQTARKTIIFLDACHLEMFINSNLGSFPTGEKGENLSIIIDHLL